MNNPPQTNKQTHTPPDVYEQIATNQFNLESKIRPQSWLVTYTWGF